ncbi:MAG: hypothetical protein F6K47_15680 [Symploca sp. SIO2E6]|nr:hypothetical protein [Symploca sp. SIO2E6]
MGYRKTRSLPLLLITGKMPVPHYQKPGKMRSPAVISSSPVHSKNPDFLKKSGFLNAGKLGR